MSILAFTQSTSACGSATHSRQPTTTFSVTGCWGSLGTGPSWQVVLRGWRRACMAPVKLAILSRAPRSYSTAAAADGGPRARSRRQGAQHPALRHRPVGRGAGPAVPRQAAVDVRRRAAAHRRLDHLLRHRRRAPVRADGRLHAEHVLRHRQQPRQAARHSDPVAPRDPDAGDDLRAGPRRRDPGDRAGRRSAGGDQAARGHPGHRRDPGADRSRSPRRSSRRSRAPGRTC